MKVICNLDSVYILNKDGATEKLKKGINIVEDKVAKKLLARKLVSLPEVEPEDEEEVKDTKSKK